MRASLLRYVLAPVLCAGIATGASASANAQAAFPPDRVSALIGSWQCRSAAGSVAQIVYVRVPDGSIDMRNVFVTRDGMRGQFRENYRFDPASGLWTWTSTQDFSGGTQESGTAPDWTAPTWIFEGASTTKDRTPIRMVYTAVDNDTFQRRFEMKVEGLWTPFSASTCKRGAAGMLPPSRQPTP